MATFLDNYEDVNARIKRFRAEFPTGRITVHIEEMDLKTGYILMRAEAFRTNEDALPAAIDYAFEMRSEQKIGGRWFIETCSTSAIGRVIGLLTPSETRPTRQDMERVEVLPATSDPWTTIKTAQDTGTTALTTAVAEIQGQLGGELVPAPPRCGHGTMVWKQAAAGSPKNWGGYFCTERTKATQCAPNWHVMTSSGQWKSQI